MVWDGLCPRTRILGPLSTWCLIFQGEPWPAHTLRSRVLGNHKGQVQWANTLQCLWLSHWIFIISLVKAYRMAKLRVTMGGDYFKSCLQGGMSHGELAATLHYPYLSNF